MDIEQAGVPFLILNGQDGRASPSDDKEEVQSSHQQNRKSRVVNGERLLSLIVHTSYSLIMAQLVLGLCGSVAEVRRDILLILVLSLWVTGRVQHGLNHRRLPVVILLRLLFTLAILYLAPMPAVNVAIFTGITCCEMWLWVSRWVGIAYPVSLAMGYCLYYRNSPEECLIFIQAVGVIVALANYGFSHDYARRAEAEELDRARTAAVRLAGANVALHKYAEQSRAMALIQARNQLARDIHDSLGHLLTSIIVSLEAVGRIVATQPEQALVEIERIHTIAKKGLQDVRQSVRTLRATDIESTRGRELWNRLAQSFAETTGMEVRMHLSEDFSRIDEQVNEVVYRVMQEGLTNAYRHGQAQTVDIAIWWRRDTLLIRISDNGRGASIPQEGFGLQGIRERVEELHGEVEWESEAGRGFDLGVQLPLRREWNNSE